MNVTISVDFGQGYRVALSPADARHLYGQLKPMFEVQPSVSVSTSGTLWSTLDMVTDKDMSLDKLAENLFGTDIAKDSTEEKVVSRMAAELEAKVKAEMDKQGLGEEHWCPCGCSVKIKHSHLTNIRCECEGGQE